MQQGLILMITGMSVVFSFLVILIFVTKFLSFFVGKYFPEPEQPVAVSAPPSAVPSQVSASAQTTAGAGTEIAAAIAAAARYTKR